MLVKDVKVLYPEGQDELEDYIKALSADAWTIISVSPWKPEFGIYLLVAIRYKCQ